MKKLNSIIITSKINEEAAEACAFIYYSNRPLLGSKRKTEYDDKLEDAWATLRDFTGISGTTVQIHKLVRRGFAVEFKDEKSN